MDLVPCVHCRRHVGVSETTCPFCTRSVPVQRPQFAFAGRLTRAAIFSAAVIGCESKTAKPAPAPEQHVPGSAAAKGSDDLEKMLDSDGHVVDHPAPVDGSVTSDAEAVAAASDAGVPDDAGVVTEKMRKQRIERMRIRHDLERQQDLERKNIRIQVNNKPYGAPPARRRVV